MSKIATQSADRPLVVPIFIPHEGCPHRCVFCNQRLISGTGGPPLGASDVQQEIQTWLSGRRSNDRRKVQVAFYGGSFTALSMRRQEELLTAVVPFLNRRQVQSLRLSTRPDCLDAEQADFLKAHQVATVELGVQSMNDQVLAASGRGHAAVDVERAVSVLRQAGMETGIQLMIGLPGDSRASLRRTVDRVIALHPDFVRIYPLLVLKGSELAKLREQGRYMPLSLDKAVLLAAFMKERFDHAGISVVRMGIQAGTELEDALLDGPWHPAFGELVASRLMLRQTRRLLAGIQPGMPILLRINNRDQSMFRGMKSTNVRRLKQLGLWQRIVLTTDERQPRCTVATIQEAEKLVSRSCASDIPSPSRH